MTDHPHDHDVNTAESWDGRYACAPELFSGNPNHTLVLETAGLAPGRVLDVGCGEGADAVWLASHGWRVTALDVSAVALARAGERAERARVSVTWIHAGLSDASLPPASFDLVSAHYPALLRTPGDDAERTLLGLVAPGGVLLVVHHDHVDADQARAHGFDPAGYVMPAQVRALLDDRWRVEVDEQRPRQVIAGAGAGHSTDVVLRASRLD